ncbi:hypothetical protein QE152_g12594 [Popillia japonica]|uniref:Uncharacterized protein n=1 Tax=Popillia japonica TaxID=7064 RepID=A0AAW1LRD1_POPJA
MVKRVCKWEVLQGEVYTYHHHIYFEVGQNARKAVGSTGTYRLLQKQEFAQKLKDHFQKRNRKISPNAFTNTVLDINRKCTVSIPKHIHTMPYWFDEETQKLRTECNKRRRKLTRSHWKKLQEDLENNVWGDGYRIAMRHLNSLPPPYNPTIERKAQILRELFKTSSQRPQMKHVWREEVV